MWICVNRMYILLIFLVILGTSKSSNSSVEEPCAQKINCTGCDIERNESDHSTVRYMCKAGFVFKEYVIKNCTKGKCTNECFSSLSNHTNSHISDNYPDVDISVNTNSITLMCRNGSVAYYQFYTFCGLNTNATAVGVKPQCFPADAQATDGPTEDLILIISITAAVCVTICLTLLIIYCVRKCRQNTRRGRHNIKVSFSKPLPSDTTEVNSHISPVSNHMYNVAFTNENGAMSNIPTSKLNNAEILDRLDEVGDDVSDVYNTAGESDLDVDDIQPADDNYSTVRINQASNECETLFVDDALDTNAEYDTIISARNPKTPATCGLFVDIADTADSDYDHLHAQEVPREPVNAQTNDTYSHLNKIHATTDYDPEYSHIIKRVKESATGANTDEQIEDSIYNATETHRDQK